MKIILLMTFAALFLSGCGGNKTVATGTCNFTAGAKGKYSWDAATNPSGSCSFSLNSKIRKAADTKVFAESFQTMFNSMPGEPAVVLDSKEKPVN